MGCIHSRNEDNDNLPNEFCVVNIDDHGNGLWTGELQVTEAELLLIRKGKVSTKWPLRSLRRYGYDGDIFSFESGRRCATGEGIYAFKCHRAEQLFNTVQQCIQSRSHNNENVLESLSVEPPSCPPGTLPRPLPDSLNLVPSLSHSDYLEPAPPANHSSASRFAGPRLGSVGSGPLSPDVHSPGSPSSSNILEVMALAPLPIAGAQVSNLYQLQDFPMQREHNNNKKVNIDSISPSYSNTGDVNSDLATLRLSLQSQQQQNLNDEEEFHCGIQASIVCNNIKPLSPTLSTTSEDYEMLSVLKNNNRTYVNLAPGEMSNILPPIREELGSNASNNHDILQTPISAMQNIRNFNFSDILKFDIDEEKHNYANLGPGEVNYDPRLLNCQKTKTARSKFFETLDSQETQPESPTGINYAVLDLDKADCDIFDNVQSLPPSSPKKPSIGYTVIDFNKTNALTQVASGTQADKDEGPRKTRHNSTALPPSPTNTTANDAQKLSHNK